MVCNTTPLSGEDDQKEGAAPGPCSGTPGASCGTTIYDDGAVHDFMGKELFVVHGRVRKAGSGTVCAAQLYALLQLSGRL